MDTGDALDRLVDDWLTLREVADRIGTSPNRVRQLVREQQLAAVRTAAAREPRVPALLLNGGQPVKGLSGTLVVLSDAGFDERESLEWLFTDDPSLPGRPVDALHAQHVHEVRRRAQALA